MVHDVAHPNSEVNLLKLSIRSKLDQNVMDNDEPDNITNEPMQKKGKKSISDDLPEGLADEDKEEELPVPAKKAKLDKGKEKAPGGQGMLCKHIKPLEWWRNKKYVYECPAQGGILVPHIKEIIRISEEPKELLRKQQTKQKCGRSRTIVTAPPKYPKEDWGKDTSPIGIILASYLFSGITCLAKNVKPQPGINNRWLFE
ncbi:hypothetical protein BT96DRAFT_945954 [Gymnopus androsaceus JB14]|uniref:Uncharacterized protein n=1 Tax=Gymnopus androsaceus JB14 TaxID=1447944 RepID=A0A6A4GZZ9_9AGAR|nr:hypothetical protein BT96DRAFT_945954 [Gymnopus androsaceus JB14]